MKLLTVLSLISAAQCALQVVNMDGPRDEVTVIPDTPPFTPGRLYTQHSDNGNTRSELLMAPKKALSRKVINRELPHGGHSQTIVSNTFWNSEGITKDAVKSVAANLDPKFVEAALEAEESAQKPFVRKAIEA